MAWLRSKLRRATRVIVVVRGDNLKQGSFVDKKMLSILNKILIDKLSTGIFLVINQLLIRFGTLSNEDHHTRTE
jgi:hypothetical protein